jgi:hypothetical protein
MTGGGTGAFRTIAVDAPAARIDKRRAASAAGSVRCEARRFMGWGYWIDGRDVLCGIQRAGSA